MKYPFAASLIFLLVALALFLSRTFTGDEPWITSNPEPNQSEPTELKPILPFSQEKASSQNTAPDRSTVTQVRQSIPELSQLPLIRQGGVNLASSNSSGYAYEFATTPTRPIRVEVESIGSTGKLRYQLMAANRIVVYLDPDAPESKADALARKLGGKILQRVPNANACLIEIPDFQDLSRLPQLISSLPDTESWIAFAEPDFLYTMARVPNDPDYPQQKAMDSKSANPYNVTTAINASRGWDKRVSAAGQIVAVIDSGIQLTNGDLSGNLWKNPRETADGIDNDKNGYIDDIHGINLIEKDSSPDDIDGHGTAVAGLIGARGNNQYAIAGVAWQVQLMPIRIFDEYGFAAASDATAAIDYAVVNGAKIINASWGGNSDSLLLKQAIARANTAGALFVAAAGNDSQDIEYTPSYPAAYTLPNVLSVAATTPFGTLAPFSNHSSSLVHIAAPGDEILSLSITPGKPTKKVSGTSFAAPLVSGIAALAREEFGAETPEQLKRRILVSARIYEGRRLHGVLTEGHADLDRVLHEKISSPSNDLRKNAIELTPFDNRRAGNTALASSEENEPLPNLTQAWSTVWYSVKSNFDKPFYFYLSNLPSDSSVSFYVGESLVPIPKPHGHDPSRYEFSPDIVGTLYIQIATPRPAWFNIALESVPLNDDFSRASLISSEPFFEVAYNRNATREDLEPTHEGGNSVWWTFLAQENAPLQISTRDSSFDTLLHIYTGSDLASLVELASNDNSELKSTHSELVIDVEAGRRYHIRVSAKHSSAEYLTLSGRILRKPLFVESPSDATLPLGATATFQGRAVGPSPITYQWLFNGEPIVGATSSRLALENIGDSSVGEYTLLADSPVGQTSALPAQLALLGQAPQFLVQPKSGDYPLATSVTLSALSKTQKNTSYQWFKNGEPIPDATSRSLAIANGQASDSASYHVIATSPNGSVTSDAAQLAFGNESDFLWRPAFDDEINRSIVGIANIHGQTTWFAAWYSRLWQSSDCFSWEEVDLQVDGVKTGDGGFSSISNVMYGNGRYIVAFSNNWAVGASLKNLVQIGSPDIRNKIRMINAVFLNGYFYASQGNELARSLDGIQWESLSTNIFTPKNIATNASQTVFGVIQSNSFFFSTDMENWTEHPFPWSTIRGTPLIHDGQRFVAFLAYDKVVSSIDGQEWTELPTIPANEASVLDSSFSDGRYIVLRNDGFLISTDLQSWKLTPFEAHNIDFLYSSNGIVVANSSIINPTRILNSTQSASNPPAIIPIDFKPYQRVTPGASLTFSLETRETDSPIDRVEFHQNGVPVSTQRQAPYTFEWLASEKGNHSIEAIVFDTEGRASQIGSTVTVIANQIMTVDGRNDLERVHSVLEAFGSTYAASYSPNLFRFNNDATWELAHTFPEYYIRKAFAFREKLYVAAGPHLYRSSDGISWQVALSYIEDSDIYQNNSWLFVVENEQSVLHARYSTDGENWIESTAEKAYVLANLSDTLVCKMTHNYQQVGLLSPGQEMRLVDLPPNTQIKESFTDGAWFYYSYYETQENDEIPTGHYRTRDFLTWERLPSMPERRLNYSNKLYIADNRQLSSNLENWIDTGLWLDDALLAEDAYLTTHDGRILRSVNGSDWNSVLDGYATHLAQTQAGYFAWSREYDHPGFHSSKDGIHWNTFIEETSEEYEPYTDLAYGNGRYAIVGKKQATSTNGKDWLPLDRAIGLGQSIAFGNEIFLATTTNQGIASSPDGLNWTLHQTAFSPSDDSELVFLQNAKAFFLYDKKQGTLLRSTNGTSWTHATTRPFYDAFLLDNYICLRYAGDWTLQFTTDGHNWIGTDDIATFQAHGYLYSGNKISSDGVNWQFIEKFERFSSSGSKIPLPDGTLLIGSNTEVDGLDLYYKTRNGHFEGWILADINQSGAKRFFINGTTFLVENEIRMISTHDLYLKSLRRISPTDSFAVGDTIHLRLEVENQGLIGLPLEQVAASFRLVDQENWHEEASLSLYYQALPGDTLQAGQSAQIDILLEVPTGTRPGSYQLVAQLNPDQSIPEYTRENNFARLPDSRLTIPQGSLSINVVGNGQVAANPPREEYALGDTVFLTAIPASKHRLKSATGSNITKQNLYAVTIQQQTDVSFEFEEARYTITLTPNAFGSIEVTPQKESYLEGETITAKANPNPNLTFVSWLSGSESEERELTFAIRSNVELSALFGQTFAQWTEDSFTEEQLLDPTATSKTSDPDNDKLTNFWEYLTGQSPNNGGSFQAVNWTYANDTLTVQFRYSRLAADYRFKFESSSDGIQWKPATGIIQTSSLLDTNVEGYVTIQLQDHSHVFLRLSATQVPQAAAE